MKIEKIAQGLVKLCKKGRFAEAADAYYADDIISIEPRGDPRETKGRDAAKAKGDWWVSNHKVHKMTVEGPFVGGKQFVVRFTADVTFKPTKKRSVIDELGLYTVRGSKIVREQFF